jgi:hypothetical protein
MLTLLLLAVAATGGDAALRPPSVPLVVHDPYFSVWSPHDRANDGATAHWTGRAQPLNVVLRVDDASWRLLGAEPASAPPLAQTALEVTPTHTRYSFANASLSAELEFTTPALPDDLKLLATPITYVSWRVRALDRASHRAWIHFDASAELAVDSPEQAVTCERVDVPGLAVARTGSVEQPVLAKKGDDLRIDWGHLYLAAPSGVVSFGSGAALRETFVKSALPRSAHETWPALGAEDLQPRAAGAGPVVLALDAPLGAPGDAQALTGDGARGFALIGYDDEFSIRYFGDDLRPYWRGERGLEPELARAVKERDAIERRCRAFDEALVRDLTALGGTQWAELCALAWRQCVGANKLCADAWGRPLLFPKENFSNGCIATVDVIYPMAPLFLLTSAELTKAMLVPVLDYASSPRWKFPFAPHDLGTYPHATGQVYGGGERTEENQMPVEESANLILLVAALAEREGNVEFALRYWPALSKWAAYLLDKGFDPERQLCTDDFAGHLAHNVNLSCKAILALGAYAKLASAKAEFAVSAAYSAKAREFAARWVALSREGDHTLLAFDKPGTWSQKYNLVWDDVLALGLFPHEVKERELAFYRKSQNAFGLPLDSRATFTKIDWTHWSACLSGSRADFEALVAPLWRYVHESPDRVPICDWSDTLTAKKINMIARPVIGGLFMRALCDAPTWRKWFARGGPSSNRWAPLSLTEFRPLVATAETEPATWRYTFDAPPSAWFAPAFDDASWTSGRGGFGSRATPGAIANTEWAGSDVWLRRTFELADTPERGLSLRIQIGRAHV